MANAKIVVVDDDADIRDSLTNILEAKGYSVAAAADKVRGMDIIITTTAKTDEEARELLRLFNFPFPAEAEKEAA